MFLHRIISKNLSFKLINKKLRGDKLKKYNKSDIFYLRKKTRGDRYMADDKRRIKNKANRLLFDTFSTRKNSVNRNLGKH